MSYKAGDVDADGGSDAALAEPRPASTHSSCTLCSGGLRLPAMASKARRSARFSSRPKQAFNVASQVDQVSGGPSAAPKQLRIGQGLLDGDGAHASVSASSASRLYLDAR